MNDDDDAIEFSFTPQFIYDQYHGLDRAHEEAQTPLRVIHVAPKTLTTFAEAIQRGFDQLINSRVNIICSLAVDSHDMPEQFAESVKVQVQETDVVLVEVHGAEQETRIAEAVLDIETKAAVFVLIHRPEEFILRVKLEMGDCATVADAVEAIRQKFQNTQGIIVLGNSGIKRYKEIFPKKHVVAIFHPYFDAPLPAITSDMASSARFQPDAVVVVGSNTTWGEMRDVEDVQALTESLRSDIRVMGYVAGKFQSAHVDMPGMIAQAGHERVGADAGLVFLSNEDLLQAAERGAFIDEDSFRSWLYAVSGEGRRVIVRARVAPDSMSFSAESWSSSGGGGGSLAWQQRIASWEAEVVDFNLQLYKENLSSLRECEGGEGLLGAAKEEFSGTLHRGRGREIFVVFESPAMSDVANEEGLWMVHVPVAAAEEGEEEERYRSSVNVRRGRIRPEFSQQVRGQIIRLVGSPRERAEVLQHNAVVALRNSVSVAAFGYMILFRHSIATAKNYEANTTRL
jgi:hypothetical protein